MNDKTCMYDKSAPPAPPAAPQGACSALYLSITEFTNLLIASLQSIPIFHLSSDTNNYRMGREGVRLDH